MCCEIIENLYRPQYFLHADILLTPLRIRKYYVLKHTLTTDLLQNKFEKSNYAGSIVVCFLPKFRTKTKSATNNSLKSNLRHLLTNWIETVLSFCIALSETARCSH